MAKKEQKRTRAEKQAQGGVQRKTRKERNYRKRQKSTSIYFLLWAVFSVLCFVIVVMFGVAQQVAMGRTYKAETAREIYDDGQKIHHWFR